MLGDGRRYAEGRGRIAMDIDAGLTDGSSLSRCPTWTATELPGGSHDSHSGLRSYPFEPFTGDLPAELLEMVVAEPVSRVRLPDGRPAWLVLGYQDCCTVLADPRFSRLPLGGDRDPGRRRSRAS